MVIDTHDIPARIMRPRASYKDLVLSADSLCSQVACNIVLEVLAAIAKAAFDTPILAIVSECLHQRITSAERSYANTPIPLEFEGREQRFRQATAFQCTDAIVGVPDPSSVLFFGCVPDV